MIKINLLPAYILERRHVRRLMQMFVVLAIVVIAAIAGITYGYARSTENVKQQIVDNHWDVGRTTAQALDSEISRLKNDKASRLDIFLKFHDEVLDHNREFARTLETISRYIHKSVVVEEWDLENDQCKLTCRIDTNENLAVFYRNLRRCPALVEQSVAIADVPEFPIERSLEADTSGSVAGGQVYTPSRSGVPSGTRPMGTFPPGTAPTTGWAPGTTPTSPSMLPELLMQPRIELYPRAEYEFEVTATLTPDYALAPPTSPLAAPAETQAGYAYPQPSGTSTRPPGPSGARGRRGAGTLQD